MQMSLKDDNFLNTAFQVCPECGKHPWPKFNFVSNLIQMSDVKEEPKERLKEKNKTSLFSDYKMIYDTDNTENTKKRGKKGIVTYNFNTAEIAIVSSLV